MKKSIFALSFLMPLFFCSCFEEDIKVNELPSQELSLAQAALLVEDPSIVYDPSYFVIDYPNGDVPEGKGVCTDVVIRAFRKIGVDLQKEVHEDMKLNFNLYPQNWGLSGPDKNIDHRRVPNLKCYFKRKGYNLSNSHNPTDYIPGDIVAYYLEGGFTHIGIVVDRKSNKTEGAYQIIHNIGGGQVVEDVLLDYKITGHYRYQK